MTTDKVRVEIHHKCYENTRKDLYPDGLWLATIPHPVNGSIMGENWVYPDRDNWIEITLPEEMDGHKTFEVMITYTNDNWFSYMRAKEAKYKIYELQVTTF